MKYKLYEKPTVGNRVLNKETALPVSCIRASLIQETVRRLMHCSSSLDKKMRTDILNKFARKLVNSGHSSQSARILLVQGTTKYLHKLKLSRLPEEDPNFEPLYLSKEYREDERQYEKKMAKTRWFKSKNGSRGKNMSWKDNLKGVWRGSTQSQKRVDQMEYSTLLRVPNTKNSKLLNCLIRNKPKLARLTGYNVTKVPVLIA